MTSEPDARRLVGPASGLGLPEPARTADGVVIASWTLLSLNETSHRFTVNGQQLFTWCALDTLFLPALLGESANVESESPVGGAKVRLRVTPQRVEAVDPPGAVVSMVLVDADGVDMRSVEAIWGTFCHHIFFFATRQEAEAWAAGRDNRDAIDILSVDEAFEVGQVLSSALLAQAGESSRSW